MSKELRRREDDQIVPSVDEGEQLRPRYITEQSEANQESGK